MPYPPPGILSNVIPADLEPSRSFPTRHKAAVIDAVTLLTSTQQIDLTEAMSRIEALNQTMKAKF